MSSRTTEYRRMQFLRVVAWIALAFMTAESASAEVSLNWRQLPPLPDPIGFAGPFAGTSGGALIVAGGANFPEKMPWEGGRKVWYDTAFVLDQTNGHWRASLKLPRALGYGVSVTTPEGVLCIGGSDEKQHVRDVFLLSWNGNKLVSKSLAPLPSAIANSCGALVGDTVYVAGGTGSPDATNTMKNFWAMSLRESDGNWRQLEPWPGPPRMLAVAASVGDSFYLAGGADVEPDAKGEPGRTYLRDAYRFTPGKGWKRIADMPNAVVAAPSPAPVCNGSGFLVIGGDDGSLLNFQPKSKHPGFPKRVLSYDTKLDRWQVAGEAPTSRATLPTAPWQGLFVIPSGETKPGVRSPEVWALGVGESR